MKPSAYLKVSRITGQVTGLTPTDDVELKSERLIPLFSISEITVLKNKADCWDALLEEMTTAVAPKAGEFIHPSIWPVLKGIALRLAKTRPQEPFNVPPKQV